MTRTNVLTGTIFLVLAGVLALAGSLASAQQMGQGPMASPMASPMGPMAHGTGTSAAYLTIANTGDESDTLLGGSTVVAETVEIHDVKMDGDLMTMFQLTDGLGIPAGETVTLAPRGLHVMLINLTRDLMPGDTFELMLEFERAGEVTVTVTVGMELAANGETYTVGDLEISDVWARPAPMLGDGMGTPDATPMG